MTDQTDTQKPTDPGGVLLISNFSRRAYIKLLAAVPFFSTRTTASSTDSSKEVTVETNTDGYGEEGYGTGPYGDTEPAVSDYANENGIVDTPGLLDAIDDWRRDTIDTILLLDVIDAWRSGNPVN